MAYERAALSAACLDWLDRPDLHDRAIAATLTFRPYRDELNDRGVTRFRLNPLICQEAIRVFLRRLDTAAYGKDAIRRGRKLGAIPIREGGMGRGDKHLHYHAQLQVPEHESVAGWKLVAANEWSRIDWASQKQNCFRDVSDPNWLSYILKLRDKPDFQDSVDFVNLRIN